jgi:hypothetical protein
MKVQENKLYKLSAPLKAWCPKYQSHVLLDSVGTPIQTLKSFTSPKGGESMMQFTDDINDTNPDIFYAEITKLELVLKL